ncbi:hypothetical protein RUM43_012600 [Polyplax serrata]|uniref:Uncharacterized protein n=1 Tax=Polyplax serrata TaxID=468196 RepID=A0AAN8P293_POLSC
MSTERPLTGRTRKTWQEEPSRKGMKNTKTERFGILGFSLGGVREKPVEREAPGGPTAVPEDEDEEEEEVSS